VLVCFGVWILRHQEPTMRRPFRTPMVPLVPILGVVFCSFLMASLPGVTWLRFFIWMVAGFVIYFSYGRFHSRVASEALEEARASAASR
jgi:basic amino acid/polyamine antiporter, APA family